MQESFTVCDNRQESGASWDAGRIWFFTAINNCVNICLLLQLPLWDGATGRKIAPETDRLADTARDALMDDATNLADDLPEEVAKGASCFQPVNFPHACVSADPGSADPARTMKHNHDN